MIDQWNDCYDDGWQGSIVPEAFSHPAKFSRGLINRIYSHAKEMGWFKLGDYCLDPFAGVALGGLDAMSINLHWIGIELEQKFVDLGSLNIDLWNRQLKGWPNLGTAKIVQGDSRHLYNIRWKWTRGPLEKADLVVSSPLYARSVNSGRDGIDFSKADRPDKMEKTSTKHYPIGAGADRDFRYGQSPGQLGSMKEGSFDMCVSSPPWEKSEPCQDDNFKLNDGRKVPPQGQGGYGHSNGQLGNSSGDTFWSASKEIVQGCYELLKLGGYAIWVTKDYVKAKKRVPFSDRWLALCESVGFKLVCRHQAMLIKEYGTQTTIHGDEKITTERKSFFRRLAESKGSPRIDWEDIICLRK